MLGDVLQQRWLVCEALVAGVALVRLVTLMASRMRLQVRQLRERLRATWGRKRLAKLWWGGKYALLKVFARSAVY